MDVLQDKFHIQQKDSLFLKDKPFNFIIKTSELIVEKRHSFRGASKGVMHLIIVRSVV